jgi:hypothetical protein
MASILNVDQINNAAGTSAITIDSSGNVAIPGHVVQVKSVSTDVGSQGTTSTAYQELTGISLSITPSSTSNKILVMVSGANPYTDAGSGIIMTVYRNGTDLAGGASFGLQQNYNSAAVVHTAPYSINYLDAPATTSAVTYKIYFRSRAGQTVYGSEAGSIPTITAMEIAQ